MKPSLWTFQRRTRETCKKKKIDDRTEAELVSIVTQAWNRALEIGHEVGYKQGKKETERKD